MVVVLKANVMTTRKCLLIISGVLFLGSFMFFVSGYVLSKSLVHSSSLRLSKPPRAATFDVNREIPSQLQGTPIPSARVQEFYNSVLGIKSMSRTPSKGVEGKKREFLSPVAAGSKRTPSSSVNGVVNFLHCR
jgi:hypothetical protein